MLVHLGTSGSSGTGCTCMYIHVPACDRPGRNSGATVIPRYRVAVFKSPCPRKATRRVFLIFHQCCMRIRCEYSLFCEAVLPERASLTREVDTEAAGALPMIDIQDLGY